MTNFANRVHPSDVIPSQIEYINQLKEPFKSEWITALRSGQFKQASHYLETINWSSGEKDVANCCFGVACRILPDVTAFESASRTSFHYKGDGNELKFMPSLLATDLGFADRTGRFTYAVDPEVAYHKWPFEESSLVVMNDRGFTFDQIADVIEYFF